MRAILNGENVLEREPLELFVVVFFCFCFFAFLLFLFLFVSFVFCFSFFVFFCFLLFSLISFSLKVQRVTHKATGQELACKILSKKQITKENKIKYVKTERDILVKVKTKTKKKRRERKENKKERNPPYTSISHLLPLSLLSSLLSPSPLLV